MRQGTSTKLDASQLPGASGRIETEAKCALAARPTVNTKKWGGGGAHKDRGRTDTNVKPPPATAALQPQQQLQPSKQQRPASLQTREAVGGGGCGDSAPAAAVMAPSAASPAPVTADAASDGAAVAPSSEAEADSPGEAAAAIGGFEAAEGEAAESVWNASGAATPRAAEVPVARPG